ncbi:hypothetical protein QCA50_003840 [Cerrena zonata]|uniref:LysM domain-containing protein n=1 Tax=Cerrena zonata TaxID=2478898 RepID=A0AAW0GHJ2_9APHY
MLPRNNGELISLGSGDSPDSLYYNPFAGHSESSFTSAVKLSKSRAETRPIHRRRGSESAARKDRGFDIPIDEDEEHSGSNSHVRWKTEDNASTQPTSATDTHPLAIWASSSNNGQNSLNGSRTRINSILNRPEPFHSGSAESSVFYDGLSSAVPDRGVAEKIVIVHQVAQKDSLAGVALKYGISLADLRRANQMWTSDSIHLRKVLYIPLDKSHRAKEIMIMLSEKEKDETAASPGTGPDVAERSFPEHNLTIRRVPASHLSFFPTNSDAALDNAASFLTLPRSNRVRKPSSETGLSDRLSSPIPPATGMYTTRSLPTSSGGSPSTGTQIRTHIASLFNALPIAPSTRENLISRLSLDSGASTPSQYSEEQDHELEDVRKTRRSSTNTHSRYLSNPDPAHPISFPFPDHPVGGQSLELQPVHSSQVSPRRLPRSSSSALHTPNAGGHIGRAEYLLQDTRQPRTEVVRTAQLEPSPAMQVPLKGRDRNGAG